MTNKMSIVFLKWLPGQDSFDKSLDRSFDMLKTGSFWFGDACQIHFEKQINTLQLFLIIESLNHPLVIKASGY